MHNKFDDLLNAFFPKAASTKYIYWMLKLSKVYAEYLSPVKYVFIPAFQTKYFVLIVNFMSTRGEEHLKLEIPRQISAF